ncbi:hypothetical protein [Kitasatospora sp. NPDC094011]|uniref:hypothetical protein n=1 Tax=Kitasatospora sp. NPDC094011 TaxID=3364090 RepID=UPI003829BEDA
MQTWIRGGRGAGPRRPLDYLQPVGLLPMTLFGLFVFGTAVPLRRVFHRTAPRAVAAPRAQEA